MLGWSERGKNPRFALEPSHAVNVTSKGFGKDFDSYVAAELGIAGTIYLSHPASANGGQDFIRAEPGPC